MKTLQHYKSSNHRKSRELDRQRQQKKGILVSLGGFLPLRIAFDLTGVFWTVAWPAIMRNTEKTRGDS